ncbi:MULTISPECIES: phage tail protein [Actinomadura]|uniref:Phage tail protein n=1 Tax=Actinomadura yumaensis TaxID=111807 RepID=A0ABW2CS95_9ACTN|nr:phage tail protein [Actinomadura sp. J1-007]MWK37611.1 phage tail protein [Actinomadura sp. J1-007]
MPGISPSDIRVAGTGSVLVAPKNTDVPDVGTAFATPWKDLGLTTNEGVKVSKKDKLDPVDSWQYAASIRMMQSDRDLTVKLTLIQVNLDTLPFFFHGDPTALPAPGAGASTRLDLPPTSTPPEFSLAVEFKDGATTTRLHLPRAVVTENDEIALARNGAVKFGVTIAALASDAVPAKPLASWLTK